MVMISLPVEPEHLFLAAVQAGDRRWSHIRHRKRPQLTLRASGGWLRENPARLTDPDHHLLAGAYRNCWTLRFGLNGIGIRALCGV